jgi:hypothetical protein
VKLSDESSPIFTYSNRATTKPGARASEHAIAYSWGTQPELLHGETGITKSPIAIVMNAGEPPLHKASRIYYGIHHAIQYNVKVRDIGYVLEDHVPALIGSWLEEHYNQSQGNSTVRPEESEEDSIAVIDPSDRMLIRVSFLEPVPILT